MNPGNWDPTISPGETKKISIPLNDITFLQIEPLHDDTRQSAQLSMRDGLPKVLKVCGE